MAQPGDEKENEGNILDGAEVFGEWRCVFRPANDSLYIMMKNVKSKRAFSNTFSKSTLDEMGFKQSTDKISKLLFEAKAGKKEELSFEVAYADKETTKAPSFDSLSRSYVKGYALFMQVAIDSSYFSADYTFKLLEQERGELDILRDIVEDMQQEMDQMKKKVTGVASWYCQCPAGTSGDLPMSGEHIKPTLDGMLTLSDNLKTITIGIPGAYKVSMELNFTSATGAAHVLNMRVNGSNVATRNGSNYGGYGLITRVLDLKKDDKVTFYTNYSYATNKQHSCFTIQKL
mmetsp:Transcript_60038/g.54038  ORF Transcript_60038/g.54038 Transcript_60038/m.54038 type:complete len:288 (-) Transcript_60038:32-895(-)